MTGARGSFEHDLDKQRIRDNPEAVAGFLGLRIERKNGSGVWMECPNPDHQDNKPSCHVTPEGGLKCFSCDWKGDVFNMIAKKRGLDIRADFTTIMDIGREAVGAIRTSARNGTQKPKPNVTPLAPSAVMPVPEDAGEPPIEPRTGERYEDRHVYRNAEGEVLYYRDRFRLQDGKKRFCPWTYRGGKWREKAPDAGERPLYGLELLNDAEHVLVVEGEKCVDVGRTLDALQGFALVTSADGADGAKAHDWSVLAGKRVTIFPDNDGPGKHYGTTVAALLSEIAASVRIVEVPEGLPDKWDIADALPEHDVRAWIDNAPVYVEDWPEPKPLRSNPTPRLLTDKDEDGIEILDSIFPKTILGPVRDSMRVGQVPAEYPVTMALATTAYAIGPNVTISPGTHNETCALWCVCCGERGSHKSQTFDPFIKPLHLIRDEEKKDFDTKHRTWLSLKTAINGRVEAKKRDGKNARTSDLQHIANEIDELLAQLHEEPLRPRHVISDTTVEALHHAIKASGSVLFASAEGAGVLRAVARYNEQGKSAEIGFYCKGWSGDAASIERVRSEPILLDHPILDMALFAQPHVMRETWADRDMQEQGFTDRFLPLFPPDVRGRFRYDPDATTDPNVWNGWERFIRRVYSLRPEGPTTVHLTPEARSLYGAFYNGLQSRIGYGGDLAGNLKGFASKLHGQMLRLALVLHVAEHANGKPYDIPVAEHTIRNAIGLADIYLDHAACLDAWGRADAQALEAEALLRAAVERGVKVFTARDVYTNHWNGIDNPDDAERLLGVLERHGLVRSTEHRPSTGRPSTRYRTHPNAVRWAVR